MSRPKRLGFFTRLLDDAPAADRYRLAAAQIVAAEHLGFDAAWVAQHHFHAEEGGLPSPFVFLTHAAALTSRIRLGTGVVTLPLEQPLRAAEDAVVTDLLSGGRLELGVGTGGTAESFAPFGLDPDARGAVQAGALATLRRALRGEPLSAGQRLYPEAGTLANRIWQATFSVAGGARAGRDGDGLLLSRTRPRPDDAPLVPLEDLQRPIIVAYIDALPPGVVPRILASRSVFVGDDRAEARRFADQGLRRTAARLAAQGIRLRARTLDELIALFDVHVGTAEEVAASLAADRTLDLATDIAVQVHPVDPPHAHILRSIELFADYVAPALGWTHWQGTARNVARGFAAR